PLTFPLFPYTTLFRSGVSHVAVGDRVYTAGSLSGTYAEQTLCRESQVHPLPQRASFAQGAAVNVPYATAYRGLFQRAQASPGERSEEHTSELQSLTNL